MLLLGCKIVCGYQRNAGSAIPTSCAPNRVVCAEYLDYSDEDDYVDDNHLAY